MQMHSFILQCPQVTMNSIQTLNGCLENKNKNQRVDVSPAEQTKLK